MQMEPQLTKKVKETPVRPKSVHTDPSYQSGKLQHARLAVAEDLDFSVPQITIEDFLKYLAFPQPKLNLNLVMKSLNKDPNCMLPSGRWSPFDKDPKDQQQHEDVVFLPITDIFNKVVDAIVVNSELTTPSIVVQFLNHPDKPPTSSARQNKPRPDSYLVLKERQGKESWADIVLSCEYKRKDKEVDLYDVSIRLRL